MQKDVRTRTTSILPIRDKLPKHLIVQTAYLGWYGQSSLDTAALRMARDECYQGSKLWHKLQVPVPGTQVHLLILLLTFTSSPQES